MYTGMSKEVLTAERERVGPAEYENVRRQGKEDATPFQRAGDLATFLASSESDGITGRLISAVWDGWRELPQHKAELRETDIYTLRRIVPKDRGLDWNGG